MAILNSSDNDGQKKSEHSKNERRNNMTTQTTALQTTADDKPISFVPYGSADVIKLSISIIQNIVAVKTRSGKTCTRNDAIKFMMMCQARKLNPFEGDAYLVGYDSKDGPSFSLITAHQAFLKRAEIHPEYDGMKSGIIVRNEDGKLEDIEGDFHLQDQEVVGGWATVYFKNRKHPTTRRIRMERFNKGFAQWQVDPAGMICKCAEADALRSSFPTMLGGLFMREEVSIDTAPVKGEHAREVGSLVEVRSQPQAQIQQPSEDERAEADDGLAPVIQSAAAKETPADSLEKLIAQLGFSFDVFQRWAIESGSVPNADSLTMFSEVPSDAADRLVRALTGRSKAVMIGQLEKIKGDLL